VEAFLASLSTVAIAEMGDRTQLLLLMLAARHRRPWPILAGMLCGTLVSAALAAFIGERLGHALSGRVVHLLVGISLVAMAVWELKPERVRDGAGDGARGGLFWVTLVTFTVAEIGDKTQIATAVLAAAYGNFLAVVAGSTLGMVLACAPVVLIGKVLAARLPLRAIRIVASLLFLGLGILFLVRAAHGAP
jgi:putative Ca2+/H+ antiporter (TMEM165/GDT1 family)